MAAYDLLAPYYDAVTGDPASEIAFIGNLLAQAHPRAATLLEVACGTGGIIAALAARYQVAGLDISPGMLAVAREKLPAGIPLHLADMSRFDLNKKFDAVICVYHGINHLLSFADWKGFFDCAYRHLNDGGMLAFDIVTPGGLEVVAGVPETVERSGEDCLRIRVRESAGGVFDWNIEMELRRDGERELLTEVIRTASFPPERVREALSQRFADVTVIETDGSISDDGNRIWFVCTGPRPGALVRGGGTT